MEIIRGKTPTAPKILLYGLSGCGKSTLASTLKNPIFLDVEGGLNYIDCARTPQITKLETFYQYVVELYQAAKSGKKEFDTVVVDSADWLVRKIIEEAAGIDSAHLTETLNKSNGGYGNGKQVLENQIRTRLLPALVSLNKQGYGICLIAHADKKELTDQDGVSIEQIAPKIDTSTMNVFVEWVDNVFYLKNNGGERSIVVDNNDTVLAKNRLGLSGEYNLSENSFAELVYGQTKAEEPAKKSNKE